MRDSVDEIVNWMLYSGSGVHVSIEPPDGLGGVQFILVGDICPVKKRSPKEGALSIQLPNSKLELLVSYQSMRAERRYDEIDVALSIDSNEEAIHSFTNARWLSFEQLVVLDQQSFLAEVVTELLEAVFGYALTTAFEKYPVMHQYCSCDASKEAPF